MKYILITIFSIFIFTACRSNQIKITQDNKTGKPMLIGRTDRTAFDLPEFSEWYLNEYTNYAPDEFVIEQIKYFQDSLTMQIFMGTWCSDSRREVPRFLKILDKLEFNVESIQIINVDRDKKSPTHEEKNKNIEFVPTFIVYKNEKELGRIVEFPIITLESDLLNILLELEL